MTSEERARSVMRELAIPTYPENVARFAKEFDQVRTETVEQCIEAVKRTQVSARQATEIGRIVRELRHLLPR